MPIARLADVNRRLSNAAKCRALMCGLVASMVATSGTAVADVCRFTGTTDPSGELSVTAEVTGKNSAIRVDVTAAFETTTMVWVPVQYLVEEVSLWQAGRLETVGMNTRYILGHQVMRQTWDVFRRDKDAMRGYRVQAKSLDDFRNKHPGFVPHWDVVMFGRPWLDDFDAAPPERRADLDLDDPAPSARRLTPLALAFYWIRWLPPGGHEVSVFLPGFKADKAVDLPMTAEDRDGGTIWRMPLRHKSLGGPQPSSATVWLSEDRRPIKLAVDLHQPGRSGTGLLTLEGCTGYPINPE